MLRTELADVNADALHRHVRAKLLLQLGLEHLRAAHLVVQVERVDVSAVDHEVVLVKQRHERLERREALFELYLSARRAPRLEPLRRRHRLRQRAEP